MEDSHKRRVRLSVESLWSLSQKKTDFRTRPNLNNKKKNIGSVRVERGPTIWPAGNNLKVVGIEVFNLILLFIIQLKRVGSADIFSDYPPRLSELKLIISISDRSNSLKKLKNHPFFFVGY